jgi:hypothetical protein
MQFKARGVFLALVAVFAMSAVTASAASAAAPEFKPSTKQAFTGTSGALAMETSASAIACAKGTSDGEITGASTVGSVVLTLSGCQAEEGGHLCYFESEGAKNKGEIVTNALDGALGEVASSEATSGVGLLLKPASGKDLADIEGNCVVTSELEGDVAAEVTPIKTSAKTLKLVFVGRKGAQKIKTIVVKGTADQPQLSYMYLENMSWNTTDTLEFTSNAFEVT